MLNEFRQDLVSGEWVLFATGRAKGHVKGGNGEDFDQPKDKCPFEDPQGSGNENPVLVFEHGKEVPWVPGTDWTTQVLVNKAPALTHTVCDDKSHDRGPFKYFNASGFHELVITRDHEKSFPEFTQEETAEVLRAYLERYKAMAKDRCGDFILILHNHGKGAGATIKHNHSQIISMPILPPQLMTSIKGAEDFYKKNQEKVFDVLINWELKEGKRVIFENEKFVAFCPYVSKFPYEIKIFPKSSEPSFMNVQETELPELADALNASIGKLSKALNNPDYNFYIHTAPVTKDPSLNYEFYRWHIEITPRVKTLASVELGTSVYINEVDPDEAAELLKNI